MADTSKNPRGWRGWILLLAGFMGLFAGLCTVFALVVTAAEAWVEHPQAQWPTATARIQRCGVDIYTHNPETYWIDCRITYTVRGEGIVSHVHSLSRPAPQRFTYQYPAGQIERMQDWVDEHPEGTPIAVHYDPANHAKAVLVVTDMPLGGPRTPNNLRLLGFSAVSCAVLLTIARIARHRAAAVRVDS
ncbi:MAG: DUF3592 domain-containing protein [Candidatus Sulfotelmatobacter sp.]